MIKANTTALDAIRRAAHPIKDSMYDYDPLMELIGDAPLVLIGEASHGTHEFYHERAVLTKRLIKEKGFTAIAVEADWPDAYRINRYVQGTPHILNSQDALASFTRFPTWMWRNKDVLKFIDWLKHYNDHIQADGLKIGFYGLDLYNLQASIEAVLHYLQQIDPEAAKRAKYRYSCFDHFGENNYNYGYSASFNLTHSCQDEVIQQLLELRRQAIHYKSMDGQMALDEYFFAEQNARLIQNAEEYFRAMFKGGCESWNKRDRHMAETLEALMSHLSTHHQPIKLVVWEHNSHIGDARATEVSRLGECNMGQLIKERYDKNAVSIGFTTYTGTVTAASEWEGPTEIKQVLPALENSYEALFHQVGLPKFLLNFEKDQYMTEYLREPKLERAIGVVYRPDTERISHYFHSQLPDQFDAIIHIDQTNAVEPLDKTAQWYVGKFLGIS